MSQSAQKKRTFCFILDSICVNLRNLWTKDFQDQFYPQMSQNAQKKIKYVPLRFKH